MDNLYNRKVLNHLLQTRLSAFFERSFTSIEQSQPFLSNWHIDLISEFLTGLKMGQFRRGNINMPPRFGKTALCSIAFPMWYLGNEPFRKVIAVSYSASLSHKIHGYCRAVANTAWYQSAFPDFKISNSSNDKTDESLTKNTQREFITTEGGFRIATSTGGSITGEGGDLIVADDLMNPEEALSNVQRNSAIDWTKGTLFSRFNNKKEGLFLNVQQRLCEGDFTGVFVDSSWENLVVPIQAKQTQYYYIGNFKKIYKEGDWLDPRRYSENELAEDIKNMGSRVVEAQYFQNPFPDDGEIFKRDYFKYFNYAPKFDYRCIYADTAQEEGRNNDFSVFMCWGVRTVEGRKYAYLIDLVRKKLTSPKLLIAAQEFWHKHSQDLSTPLKYCEDWIPPMYSLDKSGDLIKFAIEKKSSGSGLIQDLEAKTNIPVTKLLPDKDKVARANDILPRMESGQVLFPKDAPFLSNLEKELLLFSAKKGNNKKDQVDTLTYAVKDLLFDPIDQKDRPMNYSGLMSEITRTYGLR